MPLNHGLIESVDVTLAALPLALEGLRIAHVTDLHIRRPGRARFERVIRQLAGLRLDLVVMTGDFTADPGYEAAAVEWLASLCRQVRPAHGFFAVTGNHDEVDLIERAGHLPIRWLTNETHRLEGLPIEMMGFLHTATREPDSVATLLHRGLPERPQSDAPNLPQPQKGPQVISSSASQFDEEGGASAPTVVPANRPAATPPSERTVRMLLAHAAVMLPTAADMGVDLVFCGHSHGGQIRIPPGWPVVNSSDLPLRLTSGILRHRDTICLVSRGLGENGLPLRFWCPPHVPVYTLHDGPTPSQWTQGVENVRPW